MIEFITEEKLNESPTFGDVKENQFFIDNEGYLCQKYNEERLHVISDEKGNPFCSHQGDMDKNESIKKILPKVTKIKFN